MTKSRKRMLISSIAMLLVALVALGSATYAWFTLSKTVTADTMLVKAVAPAGIEISNTKSGGSWTNYNPEGVSYDAAAISLSPVSWNAASLTSTPYVPAGDVTTGGKQTGLTYKAASAYTTAAKVAGADTEVSKSANFAVYDMSVKSAEDSDGVAATHTGCTAKVEVTGAKAAGYIRAVLVDVTNSNAVKGVFGAAASAGDGTNQVITATAGTATAATLTAFNNTVSIANISATATDYKLIVWYEGYDAECNDDNVDADGSLTITFGFTS